MRYLKWAGLAIGGFVILLVLLIVILIGLGSMKISKTYDISASPVNVPTDAASIARGQHLVESVMLCQECHGENYEGEILEDDPAFGRLVSANLTSGQGGLGGEFTDLDYLRAIRHGINQEGKPLPIMPSEFFHSIDDSDLGAMIAYLKTIPPVDNELPESSFGPIGRIVSNFDAALLPASLIDHDATVPPAPAHGVTAEYGGYLANVCSACHGANFGGQQLPDGSGVFAPNITTGGTLGTWSEAEFISTLRTGTSPGRNELDKEFMPWPRFANMTDDELKAVWLYLQSLPPVRQ